MLHIRDHEFDRRLSALEAHSRKHPRLSSCALSQRQAIQPLLTSTTQTRTPPAVTDKPDPETTNGSGLSSPPLSTDNTNQDHMKTPTQNDHCPSRPAASPVQLSSPPVSVRGTGHAAGADDAEDGTATEKVSTPSQQGDAVDGLLKLMKTGER